MRTFSLLRLNTGFWKGVGLTWASDRAMWLQRSAVSGGARMSKSSWGDNNRQPANRKKGRIVFLLSTHHSGVASGRVGQASVPARAGGAVAGAGGTVAR